MRCRRRRRHPSTAALPAALAAAAAAALFCCTAAATLATAAPLRGGPAPPPPPPRRGSYSAQASRYSGARPPLDLPLEDLTHAPLDLGKRAPTAPGPVADRPDDVDTVLARGVAAAAAAGAASVAGPAVPKEEKSRLAAALLRMAEVEAGKAGALRPPHATKSLSAVDTTCPGKRDGDGYPYPHVLRLALDFYHAQRSGPLPANDTYGVPWRASSVAGDPFAAHFDAGDHLLLLFPYGQTLSLLGWAFLPENFRAGFDASPGASDSLRATLRWGAEAIMAAHTSPTSYIVQVGEEHTDHDNWGRPEDMATGRGLPRPVLSLDGTRGIPGSDAAGEGAAALAAAALAWRGLDPAFTAKATAAARSLFTFASAHEGRFSDKLPIGNMYPSGSYLDDLTWAAAWMHRLTGEGAFLAAAARYFDRMVAEEPGALLAREQSWSYATPAAAVMLAGLSDDPKYSAYAFLFVETHVQGAAPVSYTPAGLAYRNKWGSLRNSMNPSLVAAAYGRLLERWAAGEGGGGGAAASKKPATAPAAAKAGAGKAASARATSTADADFDAATTSATASPRPNTAAATAGTRATAAPRPAPPSPPTPPPSTTQRLARLYKCFARGQARYALGDTGRSFVVGWGVNPPTHVHHRAASCPTETGGVGSNSPACGGAQFEAAQPNPQVHAGALAGGPNALDEYTDERDDYVGNEVALDYNAAFAGVLAMLSQDTDEWRDCLAEFPGDLRPIKRVV